MIRSCELVMVCCVLCVIYFPATFPDTPSNPPTHTQTHIRTLSYSTHTHYIVYHTPHTHSLPPSLTSITEKKSFVRIYTRPSSHRTRATTTAAINNKENVRQKPLGLHTHS